MTLSQYLKEFKEGIYDTLEVFSPITIKRLENKIKDENNNLSTARALGISTTVAIISALGIYSVHLDPFTAGPCLLAYMTYVSYKALYEYSKERS